MERVLSCFFFVGYVNMNMYMDKIQRDLSKLVREGKDVLDGLLNIALNQDTAKGLSAWMIQICGLQGQISSLHLSHNGLYVTIPQFKINFPTSVSTLHSFKYSLESLMTFIFKMENSSHIIKSSIQELENKRNSMGKKLNRPRQNLRGHELMNWIRPTWYSPPQNKPALSTIPFDLFKKLVSDNDDAVSLNMDDNRNNDEASKLADEFGWYRKDGQWINHLTNICTFSNPYDDDDSTE
ncbi:unnamed protein product [Cunninghamella blakesleeana]